MKLYDELAEGRYPGGKNADAVWRRLIARMPEHAVYVEACVGSAALLRRKPPALRSIAIDTDPVVCTWLRRRNLPGVKVVNGCGIGWCNLHAYEMTSDWLIYLDPPYVHSTRGKHRPYQYEMTDHQHTELLLVAQRLATQPNAARVMISGYACELYDLHLRGWQREDYEVMTRGGVPRTESLWCSFQPGTDSLRASMPPGHDFRERERIGRKARRWCRMLAEQPGHEAQYILAELVRQNMATKSGEWGVGSGEEEQTPDSADHATADEPGSRGLNRRG